MPTYPARRNADIDEDPRPRDQFGRFLPHDSETFEVVDDDDDDDDLDDDEDDEDDDSE